MPTIKIKARRRSSFLRYHSLSLVTLGILSLWIVLYICSDPNKHAGSFFGNAIADWSGSLVIIVATKYFFERGSEESRPLDERRKVATFVRAHSLSIFLVVTGLGWLILYLRMDPNSKWGQVVGNIVSEWLQTLGLVWMTKFLIERGSCDSKQK